ncbi:MAG TPA: response regulator [Chloroflexota bacterium]|nr:response regulator [Chloroflexota bacterium]
MVAIPFGTGHLPADRVGAARTLASTALRAEAYVAEALRWVADEPTPPVLPASDEQPQLMEAVGPPVPDGQTAAAARILLADDNADLRDYVRRLLGQQYEVVAVPDGAAALQAARAAPFDLVLADVMMPRLDGFELLAALHADERTRTLPIILLSARAAEESRVEGMEAGADDYLVKPFSARELLARVRAHLDIARVRRDAELHVRASEERFRAPVNAGAYAVYSMSPDWSEMRFLDGRGFIADTLSPRASWLEQYIHPDDQAHVLEAIHEAVRTKRVFELEHRVRRADGTLGWTFSRAVPILGADGEIIEWFGAASDVTPRKEAEAELRTLSQRLLTVQEEERRHLARELHDEIGQALTGLKFRLANASRAGHGSDAAAVTSGDGNGSDPLAETEEIVQELTARVSALSMGLRPVALDNLGLLPALFSHVERFQAHTGLHIDLRHEGVDRRFAPPVEIAAYRIVQEALTNVARHARATAVTVQLLADDESLTLAIRDNGQGFDPAVHPSRGGLSGMRERVELLGGILAVETAPGDGTLVTAELPLGDGAGAGQAEDGA